MKKILTLILDGFGKSENDKGNAIKSANMQNLNNILEKYPHSLLQASGPAVGLPENQAGNEAVGYQTLSAGAIIKQRSSFAEDFIDIDSLATNAALKSAIEQVKKHKSAIHIIGLMSDAGINSNINDTIKIIEYFKTQEVKVVIDFIADGKDVETKSAIKYIELIQKEEVPIASICGRYYAMDKEEKWDRVKIYYDLIRNGKGLKVKEINLALKNCYMRNITDEFLPPIILDQDKNIKDNDIVIWTNYQKDDSLEILSALTNANFNSFQISELNNVKFLTLYNMGETVNATPLINEEEEIPNNLALYFSKLDISQARIADNNTYKYITNYFNGCTDEKIPKCTNYLIDVPKTVEGKELELDAAGVTKQIIKCMEKDTDFILASLSIADEVSKTGNFEKTVEVLEFLDECLGKIIESAELNFYTIIITSLYGGLESMIDEEDKPITVHSTNKVPFIVTDSKIKLNDGNITDIAPTILSYMDISIPETMKDSNVLIAE